MADDIQMFLHMDDQWMWRFFFLDDEGVVIAISTVAYFTRTEAERAMLLLRDQFAVVVA